MNPSFQIVFREMLLPRMLWRRDSQKRPAFQTSALTRAFTLIELLVVMSIIIVMMALVVPAFTSIKGAGDVTKAAYDIQGILDNARNYAIANNTFVWVGIAEVDASVDASTTPQVASGASPYGRVAVAVVASKDGTRGYSVTAITSSTSNPAWNNGVGYNNGANLVAISKLQRFENVHLSPTLSAINVGALSNRPTFTSTTYMVGNSGCVSYTPFDWPLGKAIDAGQYSFKKVINFDPQGAARIQVGNQDFLNRYIEIGIMPSHGNVVPATITNAAAIQIDGITGATHIYRP